MTTRKVLVSLALLLVACGAWAQGQPDTVELTPTLGFWFGDTMSNGSNDAFDFDVTIDDAAAYGLRLGYRFHPNWALEGTLMYEQADLVTGSGDFLGGQDNLGDMDITTGELGFEGSWGHSRLVPFVVGGIGAMYLDPDAPGLSSDTEFVGYLGAGFKLFFSPQVAFKFDFRAHSVNIGNSDDHHDDCDWDYDDCYYYHDEDWLTFREVSIGLTFVF
jgi:hypothetical protein